MMEYTMSLYRSKDDMISDMRAEITKLRAELEQERELSDRLAGAIRNITCCHGDLVAFKEPALTAHATRRNK